MNIELTIFTPAYNRAHTLTRLFESLKMQTLKNFEWLIIDDGSIDNTKEVVDILVTQSDFPIRYIYQKNMGKQVAWNRAVNEAKGALFCCLDSDDALYNKNNIFDIYNKYIRYLKDNKTIGLRFLAYSNVKDNFDGAKISDDITICSYYDELSSAKNYGERIDFMKTDILKEFLFPEIQNLKFIPEIWFYISSAENGYKFVYVPEPYRIFFDDVAENRLSRSSIKKHAKGHFISRSKMLNSVPLKVYLSNPKAWIIALIRFSQCANYLKLSYNERKRNANIFYVILSYMFFPLIIFLK